MDKIQIKKMIKDILKDILSFTRYESIDFNSKGQFKGHFVL